MRRPTLIFFVFPLTHNNTFYCVARIFGGYVFRSKIDSAGSSHTIEFGDKWKAVDAGSAVESNGEP